MSLAGMEAGPERLTASELRASRAGSPIARPVAPNLAPDGTAVAVVLWDELGPVKSGQSAQSSRRTGNRASLTVRVTR
ncbi:hypothetical protein [Limimonas halophila]|uniref:hypothetical protein n=1 Tax=Limimonas halophila TaxID=1082479 RepID=UPI0015A0E49B|nr:hypothetical protein [Limimonas halophila]